MSITTKNLYERQYDCKTLKTNIYGVSLMDILKSQKLSAVFCVKYILNDSFHFLEEERLITLDIIKEYQPHILEAELQNEVVIANDKKRRGERIDSVEDFETYMNNHL